MRRLRGRILVGAWLAFVVASLLEACASPTEIRLRIRTNMPCADPTQWKGVAVYAGEPGAALEKKAPTLTSSECGENGFVGTLVLVPSGAKDGEVGLRVVGGITYAPEDCAEHDYTGCIVARRQVRFTRHEALDLDVQLNSECVGFACDATHTCVAGRCTETREVPPVPDLAPEAGPTLVEPSKRVVRCGDNGVFCPTTGNVCCLSVDRAAGTTNGECRDPATCAPGNIVLSCDDESDCTDYSDANGPGICWVSYTTLQGHDLFTPTSVWLAQCVNYKNASGIGLDLCQTRDALCVNNRFTCVGSTGEPDNPLPGYFWCRYTS